MTTAKDLKDGKEVELEELMREGAFAEADAVLIAAIAYAKAHAAYSEKYRWWMQNYPTEAKLTSVIHTPSWTEHVLPLALKANEMQEALTKASTVFYKAGGDALVETFPKKDV